MVKEVASIRHQLSSFYKDTEIFDSELDKKGKIVAAKDKKII